MRSLLLICSPSPQRAVTGTGHLNSDGGPPFSCHKLPGWLCLTRPASDTALETHFLLRRRVALALSADVKARQPPGRVLRPPRSQPAPCHHGGLQSAPSHQGVASCLGKTPPTAPNAWLRSLQATSPLLNAKRGTDDGTRAPLGAPKGPSAAGTTPAPAVEQGTAAALHHSLFFERESRATLKSRHMLSQGKRSSLLCSKQHPNMGFLMARKLKMEHQKYPVSTNSPPTQGKRRHFSKRPSCSAGRKVPSLF